MAAASADESRATSVLAEGLTGRLAQRGSEPLGVIDVRRPQQHYARMAGWLGQRFPLLNQVLTRYHDGGEHGTGAGGFVYRVAHSFPPETPTTSTLENSFSPATGITRPIPIQSITTAGNDHPSLVDAVLSTSAVSGSSSELPGTATATATVAQPADLTPSGKISFGRVGTAHRTPAVIATAAGTESSGATTTTVAQPADRTPSGKVSLGRVGIAHRTPAVIATTAGTESPGATTATAAQPADLAPAAEPIEASAAPAMTLRVRRQAPPLADTVSTLVGKTLTETTADGRTGPAAGIPNQPATPSLLPSDATMANRPPATLPLATGLQTPLPVRPRSMARLPSGDRSIAGAGRRLELQPTAAGPAPAIARKSIDAISSASDARVDATATAGALDPTHAELPASMPLARRTAALPLSESITGTADKPALPLILEKPAAAAADPVPGLVWRKSIAVSTTAGAGNPGMTDATRAMAVAAYPADGGLSSIASPIMRAESTNPPADNQPGASSPASMPSRATALDWESLFNQFSRRLLRQLAIERERRGGKGWS